MPMIDVRCQTCQTETEVLRPLALWPKTPACPSCGGPTDQIFLSPGFDRTPPPAVVVYQAPDGSYRFPGRDSGTSTAKYDRMGYTRVEAKGFAEVRRLESRMNSVEKSRMARAREKQQAAAESFAKVRRSAFRDRIASMSEAGRQLSRTVIRLNDQRSRHPSTPDPGIHVSVYSHDRNRA